MSADDITDTGIVDEQADATTLVNFDDRGWHTYGPSVSPDGRAFAYIVDDGAGYPRAAQRVLSPELSLIHISEPTRQVR